MNIKHAAVTGGVLIVFLLFALSCERQIEPAEHQLSVQKIGTVWKVVHADDTTKTEVLARRGDRVVWSAAGSDIYFQFMDDILFIGKEQVGVYTKKIGKNQKMGLTIGSRARKGPNRYAVFIYSDSVYAVDQSPPSIIIR